MKELGVGIPAESITTYTACEKLSLRFPPQAAAITPTKMPIPVATTLSFTSPAYLLELYVTARHFAQEPGLYGAIEMRNPRTGEVTEAFGDAARELTEVLAGGDRERFDAMFEEVRQFFGPFTREALEQSSFLLDRIIERACDWARSREHFRAGGRARSRAGAGSLLRTRSRAPYYP